MAERTPLKPPPTPGSSYLGPIKPPPRPQKREKQATPAELALQSVQEYFDRAPGKKIFDYESGNFNEAGARRFGLELSEQRVKLEQIKDQHANDLENSPDLREALRRLEGLLRQGEDVIALKPNGVPASSPLLPPKKERSSSIFKRLLGRVKGITPPNPVITDEQLNDRYTQYLNHYQDPQLAYTEFSKTLSKAKLMNDPKVMQFLKYKYLDSGLVDTWDPKIINTLAHRAREMLTTEKNFNRNMNHLLTLVNFQISKHPAEASSYQSLQQDLQAIVQESNAFLSEIQKPGHANDPKLIVSGVLTVDPARINRIQAACGRYSLNHVGYPETMKLILRTLSEVAKPEEVQVSYKAVSEAGADTYLINPIQRIGQYSLIATEMAKCCPSTTPSDMIPVFLETLAKAARQGGLDANAMQPRPPSSAPAYDSPNLKGM